jgi:hypothetical protein
MESGGRTARSDLIGGAGWVIFGSCIVAAALRMDRFEAMGATLYTMPGFVPLLFGAALIVLGGVLALRGWRRRSCEPAGERHRLLNGRVGLMLALSFAYAAVLIGRVPFWLATALFVAAFTFLFAPADRPASRRAIVAASAGVLTTVVVIVVFEQIFLVRLP